MDIGSIISMLISGVFFPVVIFLIKRNTKNTDEKLGALSEGQKEMIEEIQRNQLKINDTQNKISKNAEDIARVEAVQNEKDNVMTERLNEHSRRSRENEKEIGILWNELKNIKETVKS
jgi:uncharacterized protein YlxW (UPF0749 family)